MVTLTGTFTRLDGTPATGTVRVTPSRSPIMDSDGKIVISGPQTFPLDKDGKLTTEIPASDDPDLGPAFTYAIDVNLTHASWKISKVWIPYGSTTVDLSEIADYTPTPGVATRVVTIPADGEDGQVLVWDGAGFSWDFPPEGPQGPKGDLDAEQLAGAPRLTNMDHDITWYPSPGATIDSQTPRLVKFRATASQGHIVRTAGLIPAGAVYYFTAEVKATSDQVYFGPPTAPVYHSGSGDWERLTGLATPVTDSLFMVQDRRTSGWDQIELRDPVLIDLTEVFGAGREPTKEYMDELLAKHGHYIGAVDQFAVGDALQALTVAGPGMTLRHDTSVGTRVLLDHPGGTTMLSGDTGWRALFKASASSVTVGTLPDGYEIGNTSGNAEIAIRRTHDRLYVRIHGLKATSPDKPLLTLPTGFMAQLAIGTVPVNTGSPTTIRNARVTATNTALLPSLATGDIFGQANNHYPVVVELLPSGAWPATLPGLPA